MKYTHVLIEDKKYKVIKRCYGGWISVQLIIIRDSEKLFAKVYPHNRKYLPGFENHFERELENLVRLRTFPEIVKYIPKVIYCGGCKLITDKHEILDANTVVFEFLEEIPKEDLVKRIDEVENITKMFARIGFIHGEFSLHHLLLRKSDNSVVVVDFGQSHFDSQDNSTRYYSRCVNKLKKVLGIVEESIDVV